MEIESVLLPTLQPAPFVPGGSAVISCRIGPVAMKKGIHINEWGQETGKGYGEGNKQRETVFELSPDRLYLPREMPTASSGA